MLPVAILAGGLATRLRPITATIPKALVEVAGHPFVTWQLRYLHLQGLSRVVLCVGYRGEQIAAMVGDGSRFGVHVDYVFDGERLLGTGGALRRALPILGEAFFVLYGDSFLPVDFPAVERAFSSSGKPALMTVLQNRDLWDKSNVHFDRGIVLEYNKRAPHSAMAHIDYGLSVISAGILTPYPDGQVLDLSEIYHELSMTGQLAGFEVQERFYEMGSPEGLAQTGAYLQTRLDLWNTPDNI
jgi:N-acetyl-alpha-D-muramate 1-phosphate uridylyltransferase